MNKTPKKNPKILIISLIGLIVLLIGVTFALTYSSAINLIVGTSNLLVQYEEGSAINSSSVNLKPILDTELDTNTSNVLTIDFYVKNSETSEDTNHPLVYDIALANLEIDCNLLNSNVKWKLTKNGGTTTSDIYTGSLSPTFDRIEDGRLVLTTRVQSLLDYDTTLNDGKGDYYKFQLWISDSCQSESLTSCTNAEDQSNLLSKLLKGEIEVELYTASETTQTNYELTRSPTTLDESISSARCSYYNLTENLLVKANSIDNQDYTTSTDDEKAQMYTFSHGATAQTTAQTDYRFIGSSPNNYVYYNCTDTANQSTTTCETWRILGVFPTDDGTGNIENRVKIVSGTGIAAVNTDDSSLQQTFSWDSSVTGTDGATTNYGINQWGPTTLSDETTAYAGADLMQLLNEGAYYNRTTGDCYISSSNSKITCDFNSSSTSIKTRGLLDSAKSVISDAKYYLGGIVSDSTTNYGTGSDIYTWERGTTTYNGTDVVITTSWTGEVALMYPSDYVYSYAYGVDDTCYNDSYNCDTSTPTSGWIYNSNTKDGTTAIYHNWFLSPDSGYSSDVFYARSAGCVGNDGFAHNAGLVRPVVYLESDIQSLRGDGSAESPYQLIY